MKIKIKTSSKKIKQTIKKNNNFLNNQNYVLKNINFIGKGRKYDKFFLYSTLFFGISLIGSIYLGITNHKFLSIILFIFGIVIYGYFALKSTFISVFNSFYLKEYNINGKNKYFVDRKTYEN